MRPTIRRADLRNAKDREASALILRSSFLSQERRQIVRVRITQPLSGSIDGIQLSRFVTGLTYDVGTTLGNYLLSQRWAVPVESETPALVFPIHDVTELLFPVHHAPVSEAADKPRRARKKR